MIETLAYNNSFDIEKYAAYEKLETEGKKRVDEYTRRQVETHIGERFNALLSTTRYEIKNGVLYGENMDEPFMDSLIRGRNYRRLYGNPADWPREAAEVIGMGEVEEFARTAEASEMEASISMPGGSYKHNFIDIFTKRRDEEGDYLEARRYSTNLTREEYIDFARSQGVEVPENADDVFFLENPFKISGFSSPEEIHKFLHKAHEYITEEEFAEIIRKCTPLILSYINALAQGDESWQEISFNAILNRADDIFNELKRGSSTLFENDLTRDQILVLGLRSVRELSTGCGASAGFSRTKGGIVPFSVSEFGVREKSEGSCSSCGMSNEDGHYHCPNKECNKRYVNETYKDNSERTKKCSCGFKFNC